MTSRRQFFRASAAAALGGTVFSQAGCPLVSFAAEERDEAKNSVARAPNGENNALNFETSEIRGSIRADGAYHGVARLTDKRTGLQVIDPRYSALNLFRLFSTNLGMGTPRSMQRQTKATDHSVEINWAATEGHQGEIAARYEVHEPNIVDLTVTIRSLGTYPGYEILLSSYFDKTLVPHVYLKRRPGGAKQNGEADLVVPTVNDVFRGGVLVFPRDAHAARMCLDGRWNRSEYKMPVAPFYPVRHYGRCLAVVTDPSKRVGVVLMAHPRHCFAISARYYAKKDEDRLTSYTAVDLSLFGNDFLPGDRRTAKVRLAVTKLDDDFSQPLALYDTFVSRAEDRMDDPQDSVPRKER